MLGANFGAVHNSVAFVKLERSLGQLFETFFSFDVPRIRDPTIGLQENSGSEIIILSSFAPPVTWTRGRAASAENAFVETIQFLSIFFGLKHFLIRVSLLGGKFQPRLDGSILFVKVSEIGNQILHDGHVRQRIDLDSSRRILGCSHWLQTSKSVGSVDVHCATSTDSLTTRTAKGEGGVLFIFDFDQGVQNHGTTFVHVHFVTLHVRFSFLLGKTVDLEISIVLRLCVR